MIIGIIGNGFVGKATSLFKNKKIEIIVYDIKENLCIPNNVNFSDLRKCDLIFICVPTPMNKNESCHTKIVQNIVISLYLEKIVEEPRNFIIIRSTVPPGTSSNLDCYFMPEFLTEKNSFSSFYNCKEWIIGLKERNVYNTIFIKKIKKLFNYAKKYNSILNEKLCFVTNSEAEMIKYFRNCFLALKVSFCNEIKEYCDVKDISYFIVSNISARDDRIGNSHINVPGHDDNFGYGGTCFPKDTKSLIYEMKKENVNPKILEAMDYRNDNIDRKNMDWKKNIGRAVI